MLDESVKAFLRHVAGSRPCYKDSTADYAEAQDYYELDADVVDNLVEYLRSLE